MPDLSDKHRQEFARLMGILNAPPPQYAGHAQAIRDDDRHKRRAREAKVPFTIHRWGPKQQSELGRAIDAALFATTKRQMNGCAWPDQQRENLGDFVYSDGGNWFWLSCRNSTHRVATPLIPLALWLGPRYPLSRLREKAWCTVCGLFGADTRVRGYVNLEIGSEPFPAGDTARHERDIGYSQHMASLRSANEFRFAVGARTSNAPMREGLTRAQAIVAALLAAGYAVRGGEGRDSVGLAVERGREVVAWHSANYANRPIAEAWREVHTALMQNLEITERFFVFELR